MTPELKERIARIRRGEVPRGYRRTKAGIMPDDWTENALGNCVREYKRLSNDVASIPVYSSSRKGLIPQSEYYDGKEAAETNLGYKIVPPGYATYRHMSDDDIFHFNVNQTGGEILVSSEYPVFRASENSELGFLIPALNETTRFRYFCRTQKLGGTRTRLYFHNLENYRLGVPPLAEQRRIAEILSAQDSVIDLKQRLLTEKLRQKKYLMRQFFRVGISSKRPLSTLAKITMGQSPNSQNYNLSCDGLPLIQGNADICGRKARPRFHTTEITKQCDKGDILLSVRAPVGTVAKSGLKACIGRGICAISGGKNTEYLYQYLLYFEDKWGRIAQGSTFEAISGNDIANLNVPISDRAESVASVLSAADREIELLRASLELEKRKKKALSQLLLTGIVRTTRVFDHSDILS